MWRTPPSHLSSRHALYRLHRQGRIISICSVLFCLNFLYTLTVRLVYTPSLGSFLLITTIGVLLPITAGAVIMGGHVPASPLLRILRETCLAAHAVAYASVIQLRTYLCTLKAIDNCSPSQRPLQQTVLIYAIAGPTLTLFVYGNSFWYQGSFAFGILALILVTDMIYDRDALHVFTALLLGGYYVAAGCAIASMQRLDRKEFAGRLELETRARRIRTMARRQIRLEDSNRSFVAYVLHEIRNPLQNAVLMLTDGSSDVMPATAKIVTHLETVQSIIEDAMEFTSLAEEMGEEQDGLEGITETDTDETDEEPARDTANEDIETGVRSTRNKFEDAFNILMEVHLLLNSEAGLRGVTVEVEYDAAEGITYEVAYARQFRQIFIMLLRQAIMRTPRSEKVSVDLSMDESEGVLTIRIVDKGDLEGAAPHRRISFSIQHHQDEDSDDEEGRRGGELATQLALRIAAAMKSRLIFRALPEVGMEAVWMCAARCTKVVNILPSPIVVPIPSPSTTPRGKRILLVDDSALTRRLMSELLRRMGHSCDQAEDGIQCLEMVREADRGTGYDLLLLDSMMPRLDGPGVLRELKGHPTPIISVTSNTTPRDVEMLLDLGARMVVPKPVSRKRLQEIIDTLE